MADYGVTEKGFVVKRFDEILADVQGRLTDSLGFDVAQNQQSLLNSAIVYPFVDKLAELWEVSQEVYYSQFPSTANGVNLDNACQFANISRKKSKATQYVIHCKADDGTKITKGARIASTTKPAVYLECMTDTTVERANCNGISIVPLVLGNETYTVGINNDSYTVTTESKDTRQEVIKKIAGAITNNDYKVTYDGEHVFIDDKATSRANKVTLSENLTTDYVISTVYFATIEVGDINLPNGTITSIVSNVTGLKEVTNLIDRTPGRLIQTDSDLRKDYTKRSYANSSTQAKSIESYILDNVDNVEACRVYENEKDIVDEYGRPPHSIEAIVDGGESLKIAQAIQQQKAGGIQTFGDVTETIVGDYGDSITVNFNRPQIVYAWIKVELTAGSSAIGDGFEDLVRDAIMDNVNLSIGDEFVAQSFIQPIYNEFTGLRYVDITTASTTDEAAELHDFHEGNIEATNRQKIVVSPSRIVVTKK